ncbi:metallophosphoesterase family protein [Pseudomonas syringae pv. tagetis]|uniref:Phosphoesterase n=2 Tax=Pseudomonas syringae group genomosp. 7 TaxID=251699 RepID=A0A0Q0AZ54_9PSED|nr:metallophosphoesterase family protein [Pseudomonas syringae group genomosp. 7]KPX48424.1 Phosphoesterase [Pseudomonas syringae pv. helianthi]KPY82449.1 Phosphoesterase [Pseudomonas syringae pv. tagetis]RMV42918.1 Phosphoesterase [Pseudomonas syringae pv. helianthi]RMW16857.1 Phosphoesterase [Pseudomonas syringae pv. tagetis]RMW17787.1 Phosphoesterase [Pseudomonas syringae pv. tagetis]
MKVGVISDTHGLLRPEAVKALEGCEAIIHAGDIGSQDIVEQLSAIGPLHIVRGNNDVDAEWAKNIADHLRFNIEGWQILLVHDIADVPALLDDSVKLVVTGHSHKPLIDWRGDILYLNPGSAGRRRFKLPVTLAILEMNSDGMKPSLVQLVD